VGMCIYDPQCITSLTGCLWVRFRKSTAPVQSVHGCQYFDIVVYVCKIILFVNFQRLKKRYLLLLLLILYGLRFRDVKR